VPEQGGSLTGVAAAREGIAALRAYAWLVVLLTVIGLLVGYLTSAPSGESKYRAWVTAQALQSNSSVTDLGITTPDGPQAADFVGEGILTRMEGPSGQSYDELIEHLQITQPPDGGPNPPIALIASAGSESAARALLLEWMAAIRQARTRYVSGVLGRGERALRKSLRRAAVRDEPATQREIVALLARMQALRGTLSVDYVVQRKPKSYAEATVSRPRKTAIGGVAGLIAGLALALLLSLLGGRLRTGEGIEAALGMGRLAELRTPQGVPSAEHARERLRALGRGSLPSSLLLVPCGGVSAEAGAVVAAALGEGIDVRVTDAPGKAGVLEQLERADACAVIASPGAVRRAEASALRAELAGTGVSPAGLFVV
jgi:hypothetical protein